MGRANPCWLRLNTEHSRTMTTPLISPDAAQPQQIADTQRCIHYILNELGFFLRKSVDARVEDTKARLHCRYFKVREEQMKSAFIAVSTFNKYITK